MKQVDQTMISDWLQMRQMDRDEMEELCDSDEVKELRVALVYWRSQAEYLTRVFDVMMADCVSVDQMDLTYAKEQVDYECKQIKKRKKESLFLR